MGSHLRILPPASSGYITPFTMSVSLDGKQEKINLPPRLVVKMKEKMWKSHSVATGLFLSFLAGRLIIVSREQTLADWIPMKRLYDILGNECRLKKKKD